MIVLVVVGCGRLPLVVFGGVSGCWFGLVVCLVMLCWWLLVLLRLPPPVAGRCCWFGYC